MKKFRRKQIIRIKEICKKSLENLSSLITYHMKNERNVWITKINTTKLTFLDERAKDVLK